MTLAKAQRREVTGQGPSSRANARDLRKISPFGRNDTRCHFAPWRLGGRSFLVVVMFNILQVRIYKRPSVSRARGSPSTRLCSTAARSCAASSTISPASRKAAPSTPGPTASANISSSITFRTSGKRFSRRRHRCAARWPTTVHDHDYVSRPQVTVRRRNSEREMARKQAARPKIGLKIPRLFRSRTREC